MKRLTALLLLLVAVPALSQPGPGRQRGPEHRMQRELQRPMPAPERRMGWDERQRLREQVQGGQMSREEARQYRREQRGSEPGRSPEQREQLRRAVIDAQGDLRKR